jgi:HEAT repeat protein
MTKHTLCIGLVLLAAAALVGCTGDKVETSSNGWKTPFYVIRDRVSSKKERPDPTRCLVDLDRAYLDARTTLLQGASDKNPFIRAHAIEAIGNVFGGQYSSALIQGLNDKVTLVRFASAMACGKNATAGAAGRLVQLVEDPRTDIRVVCASIYALHRLGNTRFAPMLGLVVAGESDEDFPPGRAEAAHAMGLIGHSTARKLLSSLLKEENDPAVRLSITEALARLGDRRAIRVLESYAHVFFLDLRLAAIPTMARLKTPNTASISTRLTKQGNPPRVRIAAAGAMGLLGSQGAISEDMYNMCVMALAKPLEFFRGSYEDETLVPKGQRRELSSLQQIAARSLGWMKQKRALDVLVPFLQSPDPAVAVMAAEAILDILGPRELRMPTPKTIATPSAPAPIKSGGVKLHTAGAEEGGWE